MTATARYERHGDVGVVNLRAPAGTGPTAALRAAAAAALKEAREDRRTAVVVLLAQAGALAAEPGFGPREPEDAPPAADVAPDTGALAELLESFPKPLVGALDGAALDEGMELFCACPVRLATRRSRLGFPSAALGLVPAAGGTQRLPRLVRVETALDLLAAGRVLEAPEAEALGLIDGIERDPMVGSAVAAARTLSQVAPAPPHVRDRPPGGTADAVRRAVEGLVEAGWPAPLAERLGAALEAAVTLPYDEGLSRARALAAASREDPAVRALLHLARARVLCTEAPELTAGAEPWPLGSVAVVGAGVMGSAIAILCAEHDLPVMLVDRDPVALSRGLGFAQDHFTRRVEEEGLPEREAAHRVALIQHSTRMREVVQASLVIEAVTEDPAEKEAVFRELSDRCRPREVLATNTASLDVDALAAVTACPAQVVAMHAVGPVLERRVIEIAAGARTAPEAVRTAAAFAARVGRTPVAVANRPGFVGTRLLEAFLREAWRIAEEGGAPAAVDAGMAAAGFAFGPFVLNDRIGIDGAWRLRTHADGSTADRLPPASDLPARLAAADRSGLGQMRGWYQWVPTGGEPVPEPDDGWRPLAAEAAAARGVETRDVPPAEAAERLLLCAVNQAAVLLEQGAAFRPGDVDVVAVDALGFPETRGGPLFYADAEGLPSVIARLKALEAVHGPHFHPAGLLVRLADTGRTFAEWTSGA